jgi:23S rRNA (guanosine2251-2'-O)-methyltransferase
MIAARPGKRRAEIEALCRRHRIATEDVSAGRLTELAASSHHNGFAAACEQLAEAASAGDPDLWVLIEDVQDPRNLGALLRVCEGAGVSRVLIRDRGSAPLSPAVVKTSAGAAEWLELERVVNSAREIEQAQTQGFWVYGADAAGDPPWQVDLSGKVLLCLGGEHSGLRAHTRKLCDRLVGLPMRGRIESLNVATAAAALLYEAVRQRVAGRPN